MTQQKCYAARANSNQFKNWLAGRGATFVPGKGGHRWIELNGEYSVLPMHAREPKKGLIQGIKEAAGIEGVSVMVKFEYPVMLEPAEEGGFVVTIPDVPEAHTQGGDEPEALLRAVDALETALSFYTDAGQDLPRASKPKRGQHTVRPSAQACLALSIYQTMRDEGVRKSELARRLGWYMPQVDRVLDPNHASRLDQAEAALAALGRRLSVEIEMTGR
ncbi:MAG: type II toxin-antitoxin system HicB family antitoxin [Rhodanobacteraceae bacterium]